MPDNAKKDFISEETNRKVQEFEAKLLAEQAALPDTSIRSGAGGINVLENYYFENDQIPIYDSGTNKQIDRVDMKVDRLKRGKRDAKVDAEIEMYMEQIHEELKAKEAGVDTQAHDENAGKMPPFVWVFALVLVVFGILVVALLNIR